MSAPEGRAEEGLQLSGNSDWSTLHPVRVQVWVSYYWQGSVVAGGKKGGIVVYFPAAITGANVTAVKQNPQSDNSERKKKKVKESIQISQNTMCALAYGLVVVGDTNSFEWLTTEWAVELQCYFPLCICCLPQAAHVLDT